MFRIMDFMGGRGRRLRYMELIAPFPCRNDAPLRVACLAQVKYRRLILLSLFE